MLGVMIGVVGLLGAHWVADFVLQPSCWASEKWRNPAALCLHASVYTVVVTAYFVVCFGWIGVVAGLINGAAHLEIDFLTSKVEHHLYERRDYHKFFVVLGLDQLLHTVLLIASVWFCMEGYWECV